MMIDALLMILSTIHAAYSMKGGFPTEPGEFTYIASIRQADIHYCNGLIIHENHIITVAHRIANFAAVDLRVLAGKDVMRIRWAEQHRVKEVYLHPGFSRRNVIDHWEAYYDHDIAVLRLEQSLIWNHFMSQVSLMPVEQNWAYHLDCGLISWNLSDDLRRPLVLNRALIEVMNNEIYQQWTSYLREDQKFFSAHFGTAAIGEEDIGSPLVCGNAVTGLVIKAEQRTVPGKPSIMMSIAPYLEFIEDIVQDGLYKVKPGEFPYAASLWYNNSYACGGFIVDDTHVVTVGHCVMGYRMSDFVVSVGPPPQFFSLVNLAIHPNYKVRTTDVPPNWYIDHDFALLTLAKRILWNQWTSPLPLTQSNNFHVGQLCKVLRWKSHIDGETGAQFMELMLSHVKILNNQCSQPQLDPSPQSQVPSFWGESRYLIPIADSKDVGNPIICDGSPIGFLIQAIPFDGKSTAVLARFLEIRPYIEFRNSSWFHNVK